MEIRKLQTFRVVAEELNLTKAAMKLNYSQPTVTKHMKMLEEEIGTNLMIKENGKYILTHAGEALYQRATSILKEIEMIQEINANMGKKQTLTLQSLDYYCYRHFVPAIKHVARKYPTTSFNIMASSIDDTFSKVVENKIDLGIVMGKIIPAELDSTIIGYEKFVLAISAKMIRSFKDKHDYIHKYPVITHRKSKYISYHFFKQGLSYPTIIDCDSDEVIKESILTGEILGIISYSRLQKEIESGEVVVLDVLAEKEAIHIIKNKKRQNTALDYLFHCIATPSKEKSPAFKWLAGNSI